MLRWCESYGVDYIVGIGGNVRPKQFGSTLLEQSKETYEQASEKQRLFDEFNYAAAIRVIIKAEHTSLGANTRFILTSLEGDPQELYDEVYCARGDMENRIKEQQLELYADRTNCHNWWPNQLRFMALLIRLRTSGEPPVKTLSWLMPRAPPLETNSSVSEPSSFVILDVSAST